MSIASSASNHNLARVAVLIPAWRPESSALGITRSLVEAGFGQILVVDDGSGPDFGAFFDTVASLRSVTVLRHAVNLGKGRALKTGINHFLNSDSSMQRLITADADGQHLAADIIRVALAPVRGKSEVALGVRQFAADVPLRSRVGNLLTRRIFAYVTGTKLVDTQTGLRCFPRSVLAELLALPGERYEYEMTVLAHICRGGQAPMQIPIKTVYLDGNRSSHFDPIRDSMRIYFVLARFFLSSIIAAGIDFVGFTVVYALTGNVLASVIVGRLSSFVNFALNKKFVFHSRTSTISSLWRYYLLVIAIAAVSYGLIWTLSHRLHWNVFAAKVTVDVILSLVSFSVQRTFVFRKAEEV